MTLLESLEAAKSTLSEVQRNVGFRKANKESKAAVKLQSDLARCRGKLEVCKNEFNRTIRTQAANIRKGQDEGMDTLLQEQILWDAAMGYLLVRDAIYAIQTINSYDSVEHAYKLLEQATAQMTKPGKKPAQSGSTKKVRDEYGYVTSKSARKEKEAMLSLFFDRLKNTGDIEACIEETKKSPQHTGSVYSSRSSLDESMNRLHRQETDDNNADFSVPPAGLNDLYTPSDEE